MPATHRLFIGLLLGISVVLPACSASDAQSPKPGASQPAVPVTVDRVVEKVMPLDANVVGTAEAFSTVAVRAQVTGELTDGQLQPGRRCSGGAGAVQARSSAARSRVAPGGSESGAQYRAVGQRKGHCAAHGRPRRARRRHARAARHGTHDGGSARSQCRRRYRRCRKRESAVAVRDHTRAHRRTHRRAHGACRQSRARQRSDAARRHQPGEPDLRVVRHSRGVAARPAPLHGAARAERGSAAAERRARPGKGTASLSSTTRSTRRPARSASKPRSRIRTGGSGRVSSSTCG